MTRGMKICIRCDAPFETSRTGKTVKCKGCRAADRASAAVEAYHRAIPMTETCRCGKTVIVDGFGMATRATCPRECE